MSACRASPRGPLHAYEQVRDMTTRSPQALAGHASFLTRGRTPWLLAALLLTGVGLGACANKSLTNPDSTLTGPGRANSPSVTPAQVTDLKVSATTDSSITLTWTQVDDGTGKPADYQMKYAPPPIQWGSASVVTSGGCADPIVGTSIGTTLTCTVTGRTAGATYDFQVVSFKKGGSWRIYGPLSNIAEGRAAGTPSSVTDLKVASTNDSSATLSYTEVGDGAGGTAIHQVRYARTPIGAGWGSATVVTTGTCASSLTGTAVGATTTCTVLGLKADSSYDFQMSSARYDSTGTVFADSLSNVATGVAAAGPTAATALPSPVTNLNVTATTDSSATLSFTEVSDGAGGTAIHQVRYALTPIGWGWGSATVVTQGTCAGNLTGTSVGATVTCTVLGLKADSSYDFQMSSARNDSTGTVFADSLSNVATGVTAVDPPASTSLAGVKILPSNFSLGTATWTQLYVTVTDSTGTVLTGQALSWASSNPLVATVDGNGLVTGLAPGTATITVTSDGMTGTATATVNLISSTTSSNNEPSGLTPITDRPFSAFNEDGWSDDMESTFSIVQDATAPVSPSNVGQAYYPAGSPDGFNPVLDEYSFSSAGYTTLYVSFWVKISSNWQSDTGGNKIGYMWMHNQPTAYALFVPTTTSPDSVFGSLHSQIRLQSSPDGSGGEQCLYANVKDVPIVRGQWQHWEVLMTSNTGNNYDGTVKWWIDGTLAGDYTDIRFADASESNTWQKVSWAPVYGGGGPQTVQQDQYMWMDNYYASGQ